MPEENKEKTQKKRWTLKKVKTRCRTIYWQNFLLTASVVMLTLALLGSAFFALTYSYAIDERSEQMLVRMQDIHSSFKKIYTDLRINDTKSEEIADSQGNKLVVSDATYSAAMEHPDRAFRKEFFEKLLGTYGGYINTLSSNYYALVKTNVYIAKSRGYCSARNQSLSENFIPEEVYDNLLATVRANTEPFQRYISLRNRVLGLDKSYMYDLFLPIVPDSTKKYSFDEAYELMLKATAILGEDYTALVKRSHEERWCDVYPKQGKVSGAYSTGVYDVHPYMLLNYNGTLDDVFTLLHETGHSMHSYYSDHTQPFIYSDYTLFCAEVASTTNEMLGYVRDAAALVVEEPGLNSHAAIAGKALLKPTIVGAVGATAHIRDGLMVAVDCAHGSVQRLQA